MPVELIWYDQAETILLCKLVGEFGIEGYGMLEGQMPMMVREKEHRVDAIFHLTADAKLPPWRGLFQELSIISNVMPPNFGVFVGVGSSLFLTNAVSVAIARLLLPMAFRAQAERFQVATSLPAAVSKIGQLRASV